ncbi:MAG: aldo/keto reductase [Thermoguttaceae bacterium]|nr:aldo/keto reductase [Thermoguttaceae bacterium]
MDLKRRDFLKTSLAGLSGAALGATGLSANAQDEAKKEPKNPFSTDPVGRVKLFGDVETSRIGMGTGMIGYNHSSQLTRMDRKKGVALIEHCYDSGLRFYDCADSYGTHEIISTTLRSKPRDSYVLCTKMSTPADGPSGVDVVKRFLSELKMDYIDVLQLHCQTKPNWADDCKRYMEDLEKCKEQGLIRGHGMTSHSLVALQTGVVNPWVDVVHIRLNSEDTRMDGSFEDNVAAAQKAQDAGMGVVCMKLVGEGSMKELEVRKRSVDKVVRAQVADVYIVGFENDWEVDELIENVGTTLKAMEAERQA